MFRRACFADAYPGKNNGRRQSDYRVNKRVIRKRRETNSEPFRRCPVAKPWKLGAESLHPRYRYLSCRTLLYCAQRDSERFVSDRGGASGNTIDASRASIATTVPLGSGLRITVQWRVSDFSPLT